LAPYGAAAWSLLAQSGLAEDWLAGVARVDNVHLVAAMVAERHARAGFVARASIVAMLRKGDITLNEQSILWLVPETPIRQDLVLLKRAEGNAAAQWWVTQLFEAPVQRLLVSHGYRLPKEDSLR
jgi:molybdate transport system substrate-binding protein